MLRIDLNSRIVSLEDNQGIQKFVFGTPEAFRLISKAWLQIGWDNKYVYSFTWLGRPVIQLPEDLLRIQEIIFSVKPDLIIETGIAHGGSLIFYASLCKALGKGRVIGIDIELRPHNRKAIENHDMYSYITIIEGSSISHEIIETVKKEIKKDEKILIILDSCHSKEHVLKELEYYSSMVSLNSYIIAMDGIMEEVVGGPRTASDWSWNNPKKAVEEFLLSHSDFILEEPSFLFNEGNIKERLTYSPSGFIKRIR